MSVLLYRDVFVPRIEEDQDGIKYICIENHKGKKRKICNIVSLLREGRKLIKENDITSIICDSISVSPAIASYVLGKRLRIPVTAIVTDIPTAMKYERVGLAMRIDAFFMKRFDSYVLLTEQMNDAINKRNRPYIVMEGICPDEKSLEFSKSTSPRIILYTGALWKEKAGIEYFTKGFIKACLDGYELHFYGQGEAVSWIRDISKKNSNVKYMGVATGEVIEKKQREASLLVNPRPSNRVFTKYSFPSKTIEYMLSGTPVLMTKLQGIPNEYYQYVYMIKSETAEGIAVQLKEVLYDPEFYETGERARRFIVENKHVSIQAKRVFDLASDTVK